MTLIVLLAGAALGVCSRIEETTDDLSLGVSANATWLVVAFGTGIVHRRAGAARAGAAGALVLTAANLAYYAWIAVLEPQQQLAGVCIADGIPALLGGSPADGAGLALGAALPVLSGACARQRLAGAALAAAVVAVALTGRLEPLLP